MDHFFFLGFGKGFFCVLVSGTGGDMTIDGCVGLFLLKSAFKNNKNCFNRYFLLWVNMLTTWRLPKGFYQTDSYLWS